MQPYYKPIGRKRVTYTMGPIWTSVIVNTILRKKQQERELYPKSGFSDYRLAKGLRDFRLVLRQSLQHLFLVVCGILSAGLGLKSEWFGKGKLVTCLDN